jgi:hypothetical protein
MSLRSQYPLNDPEDWATVRELPAFVEAVGKHRNWERASGPDQ